jgi:hypothetical protein
MLLGCPRPAASPSASAQQNLDTAQNALNAAGYRCKPAPDTKRSIICQQDEPRVKFVFGFEEMPARMVIAMVFTYPTACDPQRFMKMNLFNNRIDYAHASCDGKNVFYFGSVVIPERGLTAKDVTDYAHWWPKATIQAGAAAGLFEEAEDKDTGPVDNGSKT